MNTNFAKRGRVMINLPSKPAVNSAAAAVLTKQGSLEMRNPRMSPPARGRATTLGQTKVLRPTLYKKEDPDDDVSVSASVLEDVDFHYPTQRNVQRPTIKYEEITMLHDIEDNERQRRTDIAMPPSQEITVEEAPRYDVTLRGHHRSIPSAAGTDELLAEAAPSLASVLAIARRRDTVIFQNSESSAGSSFLSRETEETRYAPPLQRAPLPTIAPSQEILVSEEPLSELPRRAKDTRHRMNLPLNPSYSGTNDDEVRLEPNTQNSRMRAGTRLPPVKNATTIITEDDEDLPVGIEATIARLRQARGEIPHVASVEMTAADEQSNYTPNRNSNYAPSIQVRGGRDWSEADTAITLPPPRTTPVPRDLARRPTVPVYLAPEEEMPPSAVTTGRSRPIVAQRQAPSTFMTEDAALSPPRAKSRSHKHTRAAAPVRSSRACDYPDLYEAATQVITTKRDRGVTSGRHESAGSEAIVNADERVVPTNTKRERGLVSGRHESAGSEEIVNADERVVPTNPKRERGVVSGRHGSAGSEAVVTADERVVFANPKRERGLVSGRNTMRDAETIESYSDPSRETLSSRSSRPPIPSRVGASASSFEAPRDEVSSRNERTTKRSPITKAILQSEISTLVAEALDEVRPIFRRDLLPSAAASAGIQVPSQHEEQKEWQARRLASRRELMTAVDAVIPSQESPRVSHLPEKKRVPLLAPSVTAQVTVPQQETEVEHITHTFKGVALPVGNTEGAGYIMPLAPEAPPTPMLFRVKSRPTREADSGRNERSDPESERRLLASLAATPTRIPLPRAIARSAGEEVEPEQRNLRVHIGGVRAEKDAR